MRSQNFGAMESPVTNETGRRKILRNQLISMVRELSERGITDFSKQNDPGVGTAMEKFQEYAETANGIEDPEEKLRAFLEEYMLMFDAGLVVDKDRLATLDAELDSDYLSRAREDNFIGLEQDVLAYKKAIGEKLSQIR